MQIQVARNAAQLGTFTVSEISHGLQTGKFLISDLAWTEGMENWVPLKVWPPFQPLIYLPAESTAFVPEPQLLMPAWARSWRWQNYFRTFYDVLLHPQHTFDHMTKVEVMRAVIFSSFTIFIPLSLVSMLLVVAAVIHSLNVTTATQFEKLLEKGGYFDILSFAILLMPLWQFLVAGLVHLLLLPWRPARNYITTYLAFTYITSALLPCILIPCLNSLVLPAAWLLLFIAANQVHRLVWWKLLISLLVGPFIILLVLILIGP